MAHAHRVVQRRPAVVVSCVHIDAYRQKRLNDTAMALGGRVMKRSRALGVNRHRVETSLHESLNSFSVTIVRGVVQWRNVIAVEIGWIEITVQQRPDGFGAVLSDSEVQRRLAVVIPCTHLSAGCPEGPDGLEAAMGYSEVQSSRAATPTFRVGAGFQQSGDGLGVACGGSAVQRGESVSVLHIRIGSRLQDSLDRLGADGVSFAPRKSHGERVMQRGLAGLVLCVRIGSDRSQSANRCSVILMDGMVQGRPASRVGFVHVGTRRVEKSDDRGVTSMDRTVHESAARTDRSAATFVVESPCVRLGSRIEERLNNRGVASLRSVVQRSHAPATPYFRVGLRIEERSDNLDVIAVSTCGIVQRRLAKIVRGPSVVVESPCIGVGSGDQERPDGIHGAIPVPPHAGRLPRVAVPGASCELRRLKGPGAGRADGEIQGSVALAIPRIEIRPGFVESVNKMAVAGFGNVVKRGFPLGARHIRDEASLPHGIDGDMRALHEEIDGVGCAIALCMYEKNGGRRTGQCVVFAVLDGFTNGGKDRFVQRSRPPSSWERKRPTPIGLLA